MYKLILLGLFFFANLVQAQACNSNPCPGKGWIIGTIMTSPPQGSNPPAARLPIPPPQVPNYIPASTGAEEQDERVEIGVTRLGDDRSPASVTPQAIK